MILIINFRFIFCLSIKRVGDPEIIIMDAKCSVP